MATYSYEETAAALGSLCMDFQGLENRLLGLFSAITDKADARVGAIIGSQLSFRKLCHVVDAICRYRIQDKDALQALSDVIGKCLQMEQERNTYIHSYYETIFLGGEGSAVFDRFKQKIKLGKGYSAHHEEHDITKLHSLSTEMNILCERIDDFVDHLREIGIVLPDPTLTAEILENHSLEA
jgi:hypothetical protein